MEVWADLLKVTRICGCVSEVLLELSTVIAAVSVPLSGGAIGVKTVVDGLQERPRRHGFP